MTRELMSFASLAVLAAPLAFVGPACGPGAQGDSAWEAHAGAEVALSQAGDTEGTREGGDHSTSGGEGGHPGGESEGYEGSDEHPADAPVADHYATDEHAEGGDHHHAEGSDLDREPGELFAAKCEHGVCTYQCEECRYEVGVVRVPMDLIEEGLIDTALVQRRSFGNRVELTGEIRFDERKVAHLGPRLPGIVRRVFVDLGQPASAGDPLIEMDSPELAEVQATYLEALAEYRLARRNYERQSELREAKISSEREFFEAGQSLETAEIRSNSGRQRLLRFGITESEIARLEREGIAGATGRYLLKAPFAGQVLDLHAVRGERVELDRELALFGSTETLWVWVDLYESYLDAVAMAQVDRGIEATVSVKAYPGETFEGQVDFIGSTMNETTRTVKARVTLENEEGKLRPGMFATVSLVFGDGGNGAAVPSSAVLSDEGRDFVFVRYLDDYFLRRGVRMGRTTGDFVEIVEGLSPGQTVATRGSFLLKSDVLRSKMGEGCAH